MMNNAFPNRMMNDSAPASAASQADYAEFEEAVRAFQNYEAKNK
jgi:hypothetical protein